MVDRNLAKNILGAEKKQEEKPKTPPTSPKQAEKKPMTKKDIAKTVGESAEKKPEEKRGILNIHTIDNYMDKNTRGMFNDIDEDKPFLSLEDLALMKDYEEKHRKRKKVLNKIQEVMIEIKKKLKIL